MQAVRETVQAVLTSPALTYQTDTGTAYGTATLPASSVVPRAVWLTGGDAAPNPLVCFSAQDVGDLDRVNDSVRQIRLKIWVVGDRESVVTYLYEAVRARFNFADQDAIAGVADNSVPAAAYALPLTIRSCKLSTASDCDFDAQTGRWYILATFRMYAV